MGYGSRLALAQTPAEAPALTDRVRAKLTDVPLAEAMSASDLLKQPEFTGQDPAQVQAALDYLANQQFLLRDKDGKYYDQITHGG